MWEAIGLAQVNRCISCYAFVVYNMCVNIAMYTWTTCMYVCVYTFVHFSRQTCARRCMLAQTPNGPQQRNFSSSLLLFLLLLLLSECIALELNLNVLVSLSDRVCLCMCARACMWTCTRTTRASPERLTAKASRNFQAPSHANNLN